MDTNVETPCPPTPGSPELSEAAVCARIDGLRKRPLHEALPRLMLELDRVLRARIPAELRLALMHCLKKPVLKAAAGLPKPVAHEAAGPTSKGAGNGTGMTLEQRLLLLMIRNLRHTLYEIDRSPASLLADDDTDRSWLLQQVFRFIGRQIRYGIDWDRPWPKHTWQDLHDLFVYLVVRGSVQIDSTFSVALFEDDFDAEVEYKRLLLLGLADRLTDRRSRTGDFYHLLRRWASESRLQEPERAIGEERVFKVDVVRDEPPRLREARLEQSFRGWVLRPSAPFLDFVAHVDQGGGRVLRFNAFRSATSSRL